MTWAIRVLPLLAFAVVSVACAAEETAMLVRVDADPAVRDATGSAEVTVLGGDEREARFYRVVPRGELVWPIELWMEPRGDDASRELRVSVRAWEGLSATGALVSSRFLRAEYLLGVTGLVDVRLDAACAEVRCNEARDETCYQGECSSGDLGEPEQQWAP